MEGQGKGRGERGGTKGRGKEREGKVRIGVDPTKFGRKPTPLCVMKGVCWMISSFIYLLVMLSATLVVIL